MKSTSVHHLKMLRKKARKARREQSRLRRSIRAMVKTITASALLLLAAEASAAPLDVNRLADAIKREENSKGHPYGVMIQTRNPRQVCINTIVHAAKDWNRQGDFIDFLSRRYCPPNHRSWAANVKWLYWH